MTAFTVARGLSCSRCNILQCLSLFCKVLRNSQLEWTAGLEVDSAYSAAVAMQCMLAPAMRTQRLEPVTGHLFVSKNIIIFPPLGRPGGALVDPGECTI